MPLLDSSCFPVDTHEAFFHVMQYHTVKMDFQNLAFGQVKPNGNLDNGLALQNRLRARDKQTVVFYFYPLVAALHQSLQLVSVLFS